MALCCFKVDIMLNPLTFTQTKVENQNYVVRPMKINFPLFYVWLHVQTSWFCLLNDWLSLWPHILLQIICTLHCLTMRSSFILTVVLTLRVNRFYTICIRIDKNQPFIMRNTYKWEIGLQACIHSNLVFMTKLHATHHRFGFGGYVSIVCAKFTSFVCDLFEKCSARNVATNTHVHKAYITQAHTHIVR